MQMKILFQIGAAAIWVHFCWGQILEPEDVKDLGGIWWIDYLNQDQESATSAFFTKIHVG